MNFGNQVLNFKFEYNKKKKIIYLASFIYINKLILFS